jgi:uncharacterized protein YndB with AHSA1/START domain
MAEYATTIDIDAEPEIVFEHLTTDDGMVAWMGQHADLDPTPGGRFAVDVSGSPIRGTYVEVDPPRRVVVTWGVAGSDEHPPGSSRVEFDLESIDGGTRLSLHHRDIPDVRAGNHERGWVHFLDRLVRAARGDVLGPDDWAPAVVQP